LKCDRRSLDGDAQLPEAGKRLESALADAETDDLVAGVVSDLREDGSVWIGVHLRRDGDPMLGHLLDDVVQSARSGTVGLDYFHTTLWFVPDLDPREAATIIETVAASYLDQAADRLQGVAAVEHRRHTLELEARADALDQPQLSSNYRDLSPFRQKATLLSWRFARRRRSSASRSRATCGAARARRESIVRA
jgi:hypothetical protein